jgi:hypothetical protein
MYVFLDLLHMNASRFSMLSSLCTAVVKRALVQDKKQQDDGADVSNKAAQNNVFLDDGGDQVRSYLLLREV